MLSFDDTFFQILYFLVNIDMVRCEPFAGLTSQLNMSKLLFFHQLGMNINVEAYWNQNRKTKNEPVIVHLPPPLMSPFPKKIKIFL